MAVSTLRAGLCLALLRRPRFLSGRGSDRPDARICQDIECSPRVAAAD